MGLFKYYINESKKPSSREEEILQELQVNGQNVGDEDDYTMEDDNNEDPNTEAEQGNETPADAANDAADDTGDDYGDEDDDFTLEDDDYGDMNETEGEAPADDAQTNDQGNAEAPAENQDQNAAPENNAGADDAGDNFDMGDNAGGDANNGENQEGQDGGENQNQDNGQQNNQQPAPPKNPTDAIEDQDSKAAEEEIYETLSDEQKQIRLLQLKYDYKELYETITTTIERINNIPKNDKNIETVKKLVEFLTKARKILIDYVANNFNKNPYIENYVTYIKFEAVFRTVAKVIEELNKAKEDN